MNSEDKLTAFRSAGEGTLGTSVLKRKQTALTCFQRNLYIRKIFRLPLTCCEATFKLPILIETLYSSPVVTAQDLKHKLVN